VASQHCSGRQTTARLRWAPTLLMACTVFSLAPSLLKLLADRAEEAQTSVAADQVGWEWRGIAVWSPSGCRLMCSLRQAAKAAGMTPRTAASLLSPFTDGTGVSSQPLEVAAVTMLLICCRSFCARTPYVKRTPSKMTLLTHVFFLLTACLPMWIHGRHDLVWTKASCNPLQSGIASLAWGAGGFALLLAEARAAGPPRLLELSFAHSLTGAHRVQHFSASSRGAAQSQQGGIREAHLLLVSV
jgi:hypothetical protein